MVTEILQYIRGGEMFDWSFILKTSIKSYKNKLLLYYF